MSSARASKLLKFVVLLVSAGALLAASAQATLTNWSISPSPNLSGVPALTLGGFNGVSCPSATSCVAVGDEVDSSDTEKTLVESSNGTAWSIVPSPNQGSNGSALSAVSCTSASFCVAAGFFLMNSSGTQWQNLVESWDGTSWSIVPSPTINQSMLHGVSCTSTTFCVAVGDYYDSSNTDRTLVESWNGSSWSVVPSVDPGLGNLLSGVSCTSVSSCQAVGYIYTTALQQQTLAESWNGTSWSVASSPNPTGFDALQGVSCASATSCVAVGDGVVSSPCCQTVTVAESWNGTTWSIVSSPNHGTDTTVLYGVSCVSATFCAAAGYYYDQSAKTSLTAVETWDGTTWSLASTPNGSGPVNILSGVSCADTSHCVAVGEQENTSTVFGTLVVAGVDGDLALTGVPANITTDATGPNGALVAFTAPTATDEETPPAVTCDHTSGATFAIGTTKVTCSTTDSDDDPSTASASFTITVNGAAAQLTSLVTYVTGLGPGHALQDDIQTALGDVAANDKAGACKALDAAIALAKAQSGKKLTVAQATQVIAVATQIKNVLGC